jgi:hypothetical protein
MLYNNFYLKIDVNLSVNTGRKIAAKILLPEIYFFYAKIFLSVTDVCSMPNLICSILKCMLYLLLSFSQKDLYWLL